MGRKRIDFSKYDLTAPAKLVAKKAKACPSTVYLRRRELGVKAPRSYTPSKETLKRQFAMKKKWQSLDWTLQDTVLAGEMGVTRERVRQWRRKLGMPNASLHRHMTDPEIQKRRENALDVIREVGGSVSDAEIARKIGASGCYVSKLRSGLGIERHDRDGYMAIIDWRLSNSDLGKIWKRSRQLFANYRCQNKKGVPKWNNWFGKTYLHDPEYLAAINAQLDAKHEWDVPCLA